MFCMFLVIIVCLLLPSCFFLVIQDCKQAFVNPEMSVIELESNHLSNEDIEALLLSSLWIDKFSVKRNGVHFSSALAFSPFSALEYVCLNISAGWKRVPEVGADAVWNCPGWSLFPALCPVFAVFPQPRAGMLDCSSSPKTDLVWTAGAAVRVTEFRSCAKIKGTSLCASFFFAINV